MSWVLVDEYTVPSPVATVTLGAGSNGSAGNNFMVGYITE